jgi:AMP-polyphosphate phosphotransferase
VGPGTTHIHDLSAAELDAELAALRDQLAELQLPQVAYGRRAIILFEGPEGAGKKHVLRQLVSAFDPCQVAVHRVSYDRREAAEGHWLARFWRQLPGAGETAIFFRSWYRRVLDDRILGKTDETGVARAFDEINEFEAQQRDYGTMIVKLYFDVSADVQEQRLRDRALNPWAHATMRDDPVHVRDEAYRRAFQELRRHSDTRWSPWRMIDGDDERKSALVALAAIAEAWAQAIPAEPPRLMREPNQAA